ncbi:hypothetical protein ABB27_09335 [Stenotrophomonas terrae]|uniref:Pyruvate carboxyltransferase domain-containing protein n=1 Tax=Stenotrophomonas terrae TaxID=405446 RepID=A0A0R0CRZ7_9GAMM|nr:hydroxymethylglutaryl-CoA lyase [Stenotrophomonas terrae]KRG67528.1 hypothetical protein ABB27_09335 [Stenotrophomonas terrae]
MIDDHAEVIEDHVRIIEVGAHRGLQSQAKVLPVMVRSNLIELLESAGIAEMEVGSFSPQSAAAQMTDATEIYAQLGPSPVDRIRSVLVPDMKGLEMAVAGGFRDITVALAASNAYCRANLNCNIDESLRRADQIAERALTLGIQVRATLSTIIHCPLSGAVAPADVTAIVATLHNMGCREISLCDTTGSGTPASVGKLLRMCAAEVPMHCLAAHFHDTYGLGVANMIEALEQGVRAFDGAISGLDGDSHAADAACSLATEDLVYLCSELGVRCHVDLDGLLLAADYIDCVLERRTGSRVGRALRARRNQRERAAAGWAR